MREAVEHAATSAQSSEADRVLLTGAGGFLGRAILRQLTHLSIKSTLTSRSLESSPSASDRDDLLTRSVAADLCSDSIPDDLYDGVREVIHTAGLAHQFGDRANDVKAFEQLNHQATERLVRLAIERGVEHFVLISTVAVYGNGSQADSIGGSEADSGRYTEETACDPQGPYATTKYDGEQAAIRLAENSSMRLTVLRMTTIFGEGDRGNTDRLLRMIDAGRFVSIGNGQNVKSLIHLKDAARACVAVLDCRDDRRPPDESNVNIYNVSADPVPMNEVVSGLALALGKRPARWFAPATPVKLVSGLLATLTGGKGRLGRLHQTITKWLKSDVVDAKKFHDRFGFTTEVSLSQGLVRQVQAYRRNNPFGGRVPLLKRVFDFVLAVVLCLVFAIPMLCCYLAVRLTSKGPAIYWSKRVGINQRPFWMAKFRSMRTDTPSVATHLLQDSKSFITPVGRVLRKTSLDELPQLWNVLTGQMSFVGPRPALVSQDVVNTLRHERGVSAWTPGITGWAQVNGRDELVCEEKVEFDYQYTQMWTFGFDLKIILQTVFKVFAREGIRQADDDSSGQALIVFHDAAPVAKDDKAQVTLVATAECLPAASLARDQLSVDFGEARLIGLRPVSESSAALESLISSASRLLVVIDSDSAITVPGDIRVVRLSLNELTVDNRQRQVALIVEQIRSEVPRPRALGQERANANV